jgi:hypothetical protein
MSKISMTGQNVPSKIKDIATTSPNMYSINEHGLGADPGKKPPHLPL